MLFFHRSCRTFRRRPGVAEAFTRVPTLDSVWPEPHACTPPQRPARLFLPLASRSLRSPRAVRGAVRGALCGACCSCRRLPPAYRPGRGQAASSGPGLGCVESGLWGAGVALWVQGLGGAKGVLWERGPCAPGNMWVSLRVKVSRAQRPGLAEWEEVAALPSALTLGRQAGL